MSTNREKNNNNVLIEQKSGIWEHWEYKIQIGKIKLNNK